MFTFGQSDAQFLALTSFLLPPLFPSSTFLEPIPTAAGANTTTTLLFPSFIFASLFYNLLMNFVISGKNRLGGGGGNFEIWGFGFYHSPKIFYILVYFCGNR